MRTSIARSRWWAVGAVVLAVALIGWAVWFSPLLTVRAVRVLGAPAGDAAAIVAAAAVPPGSTLVHVDVAGVRSRVGHVPRIATVTVRRDWPNTLVIVVTERAAIGVVQAGTRFQQIDVNGVAFGAIGPRSARQVLVTADGPARAAAATALAELPLAIYARVDTASATTGDNVSFTFRTGQVVVWGSTDDAAAKARVLQALLLRVRAHRYDVSAPMLPTTS